MLRDYSTGIYEGRLGTLTFRVVSDGPIDVGPANDLLKPAAGLTLGSEGNRRLELAQNVLVLGSHDGWVLFETGSQSVPGWPEAGRLPANLARAGIAPSDIVALVPTHAHLDHVGGIVDANGCEIYPNAAIHMAGVELDFWLHEDRLAGRTLRSATVARANLSPRLDRVVRYQPEQDILPGVHALSTPGHTIGHSSFLIGSGTDLLCVIGDLAHDMRQLAHPDIATVVDFDPDIGTVSRRRSFEMLASRRILTLFYHFPWPGLGYLEKVGVGFRFIPISR